MKSNKKYVLIQTVVSLILGILLSVLFTYLAYNYHEIVDSGGLFGNGHAKGYLTETDKLIAALIVIGFPIGLLLYDWFMYTFMHKTNIVSKWNSSNSLSKDKLNAQHTAVPKQYLSKELDGLIVGKYGRKYVRLPFFESPEHQLILGSPGSNKSSTLLNALLINFNFKKIAHAVLAIDSRPELSKKSVDEDNPSVKIINPAIYGKWGFDIYYGLNEESSDDALKTRMRQIASALIPNLSGDNAHFSGSAQNILTGALMYGFRKGMSITDSLTQIKSVSVEDFIAQVITDPDMKLHPKIVNMLKMYDGNDSDEFKSIVDTLGKDLDIFENETVQYCFSKNPNKATPNDLINGTSLFLAIPDYLLDEYSRVFGMIIELCVKHIMAQTDEVIDKRVIPIWFLLDEGGTIYVPSLMDAVSRGRGKKLQVSIVAQSLKQLRILYGRDEADSILDCCKTTIVTACNDTETAEQFSKWCGQYRETKTSYKKSSITGAADASGTNVSQEYRNVMDVSDIKNLEKNNEVLVFAKGDWFLVQKAPYFTISELNAKSKGLVEMNKKNY